MELIRKITRQKLQELHNIAVFNAENKMACTSLETLLPLDFEINRHHFLQVLGDDAVEKLFQDQFFLE